jgi:hypothetical protein
VRQCLQVQRLPCRQFVVGIAPALLHSRQHLVIERLEALARRLAGHDLDLA